MTRSGPGCHLDGPNHRPGPPSPGLDTRAHPRSPWNRSRRRPAHGQHTHRRQRRPV